MDKLLYQLSQPFEPQFISFKPGKVTNDSTRCLALTYADLRAYMHRLDEAVGRNWSVKYLPWGDGRLLCELTIEGITRTSSGESDAQDAKNNMAGTVTEAQAFKRACAMFGLGRDLYEQPSTWVEFDAGSKTIAKAGLLKLQNQYRAYYTRTMAARAQRAKDGTETVTAEEILGFGEATPEPEVGAPSSNASPDNDVEFTQDGKPPRASSTQQDTIETLLAELYEDYEVERQRIRWTEWATENQSTHLRDLTPDEATTMIVALGKRIEKRQKAQPPINRRVVATNGHAVR